MNPGYVITSESFKIEISDKDGNRVVKTTGGMLHTTTPGSMIIRDWYASNRLVSSLSELTFSVQPLDPTSSSDVQLKLRLPEADFEELPEPCVVSYHNQLVNDETWKCETDPETNSFVLQELLKDPYEYEEFEWIEVAIDDIKMPSSSRPTGEYEIEFYDNINGVYRLVDVATVSDKFQALPGGLYSVRVEPEQGTTYTKDTMKFIFTLGHKILQNGYLTIKLPPQLEFIESPECLAFSALID